MLGTTTPTAHKILKLLTSWFQRRRFFCVFLLSTGDDDPRGVVTLDPSSMIDRIYVEYQLLLLHTKYKISGPHGLRDEDFFFIFLLYDYRRC